MGVYKRPDSKFYWLLLERPHAKAIRERTQIPIEGGSPEQTKDLLRLARAAYAARMAELARKRFKLPGATEGRTFQAHRAWYAAHVSPQKRGTSREISMLKQLGRFFDEDELESIDHARAIEWRTTRRTEVSDSTVRREEALLKHLLTTAVPKYLEANPLRGLRRLRVPETDTRVLTPAEERRLLTKGLRTAEDRALVIGALDTLLRLSNIATLTRRQDHGTYLFTDTKVGAVKIPISRRFRQALDTLQQQGLAGELYFPTYAHTLERQGRHVLVAKNSRVIAMFAAACAVAGVKTGRKTGGVSFHCLRHTGASRMLERGADVKTVMEIGGWKNLKVMERYLHPSEARKRAAVNAIGARRRPKPR